MATPRDWQIAIQELEAIGASVVIVNLAVPLNEFLLVSLSGCQVGDEVLPQLKRLAPRNLKIVDLGGTRVTDAGLEHLAGLKGLWKLRVTGTRVTDAGIKRLQQDLPNCEIAR